MSEEFWKTAWQVVRVIAIWVYLFLSPQIFMTLNTMQNYYEMKIEQGKSDE